MFLNNIMFPSSTSSQSILYGTLLSLCYSVIYILLSYILFYLRYNVSERVEQVILLYSLYVLKSLEVS